MRLTSSPLALISNMAQWHNRRRDLSFDKRLGIDTEDWASGKFGIEDGAEPYSPTPTQFFRRIIRAARVSPADFAFVDLGSGKGRTLLLASSYGFNPVIGVELDERLWEIARQNLDRWDEGKGARPTIFHADARDAPIPDGNLFVFMFNPFTGALFEDVAHRLATLATEEHRAVLVAYSNDVCGDVLERTGTFRRVRLRPLQFWRPSKMSLFYNQAAWNRRCLRDKILTRFGTVIDSLPFY